MLFRQITDLKKTNEENLFQFYNRLIAKCYEYKKFLSSTLEVTLASSRIEQAEKYILDTFLMEVGMNFRPILIEKNPRALQEAYNMLRKMEADAGVDRSDSIEHKLNEILSQMKLSKISGWDFANPQIRQLDEVTINRFEANRGSLKCQWCDRSGHEAKDCFKIKEKINIDYGSNGNIRQRNFNGYSGNRQEKNWSGDFKREYNYNRNNRGNSFSNGGDNSNRNRRNNSNWNGGHNSSWNNNNYRQNFSPNANSTNQSIMIIIETI